MKRYTKFQRLMSIALSIVMVLGLLPAITAAADDVSAGSLAVGNPVVDPNTMDQWMEYFGPNVLSTEFAGGVWTDKTVLANPDAFNGLVNMKNPGRNFLIALSAIAANQQVMGYASTPMDVMLALDVSGSMDSSKIRSMVEAANQSIESLLSQNKNNRVGVVLYSGTRTNSGATATTVVLPLDHYTTTSQTTITGTNGDQRIPAYLTFSSDTVSVASGVRNSKNARPTGSREVVGATYIQRGLYDAWLQFQNVTDTVVPEGNVQAGAKRTPVMILMSDGQPTLATDSYNNVTTSDSDYGNGTESGTTYKTAFLTQLTASWVKGKMAAHYGTPAKFYTLGLGTGNSQYATAVLNPGEANTTLDGYWNNFFNNSVNSNGEVQIIPRSWGNSSTWSVYKDGNVKVQNYVDMYKLAADTDDLLDAFESIVNTIQLEAAGYVTLVDQAGENLSGYITFTDELGIFMEVKDVKGLLLGNVLFTGAELAKSLQETNMGSINNPTAYGDEFVNTVKERLGITDTAVAQQLIMAAYADGQLAYDAATGAYSNYIGWYSNGDGDYLGFWDKDTGITAQGAPEGTTWINKSYSYLGTAVNSDMMHIVVMVSTHIESGMQVVTYKIPAALIPTVLYKVELAGEDPTDMKSITRQEAFPLRLVYEVGLQEDINSVTVAQKVQEAKDAGYGHSHIDANGNYEFYTNLWGAEDGDAAIDYSDPMSHKVAQSHFHPAVGNDRYYFVENTPVYTNNNGQYVLYTGTTAPSGNGFYHRHDYYTAEGYTFDYLPISSHVLELVAAGGREQDGTWSVPAGTVFQQIDRFRMLKGGDANGDGRADANLTGTLEYYDYPVVVDIGDRYDTYAFLGNNGKITVAPAQGIKLTKTVTEMVAGAPDTFTFHITLSRTVENPSVTDGDGVAYTGAWSVSGNVITVALKAGQTVYITGLPTGVTYTVTEAANSYYAASSTNATGVVTAGAVNAVDFVNVPKGYGNLIVSKDVDHPYTTVPAALTNKEFTINVTLSGEDVANKTFQVAGSDSITAVTTDANGRFTVKLKDNGSLTVVGLPEGTTFVTTETLDAAAHKGFRMDANRSILTGTIVKDTAVQSHVVNVYAPAAASESINIVGTKTLVDEAGAFDWTGKNFTIRLEHYDPATGTYTTVDEATVSKGSLSYAFMDKLTFDAIGTYYYKVTEVIPTAQDRLEGMSYDASAGRFEVRVTDDDVDGQLEIAVYNVDTMEAIPESNGTYTFSKNFVNTHVTDATYVEFTVDKNVVDPHNTGTTGAGYLFELYEVINGVVSATPAYSMRTQLVNGVGQATFHIPVVKVGSRTFILKETHPADADKIGGMIYDTKAYTVVVSASSEDGKLVPKVEFSLNGQTVTEEDLVFTNVIDLDPVTLRPYVTKILVGREPLSDTEFTFQITETDGSFATPKAGGYSDTVAIGKGNAYFKPITVTTVGTYYYRVVEVAGNKGGMTYDNSIYHITVNVTVEDGELVKDVSFVKVGSGVTSGETDSVEFTNIYKNTDTAQVTLGGNKTLTGRALRLGEFRFTLSENGRVLQTVSNLANGEFSFAPITYTAADVGTHVYTIAEVKGSLGGVGYDTKTYTVTVTVTDNNQGELVVNVSGAEDITFRNTYTAQPTKVLVAGMKTWYNTDTQSYLTMQGGEFHFALYQSNAAYNLYGSKVETANSADGSFGFLLDYTAAGDYYYLLSEVIEDAAGVNYDTGTYRIKVSVYDDGAGALIGRIASIEKVGVGAVTSITFGNRYTPDQTEVVIEGTKELTGHTMLDGEFRFQLLDSTGTVLQTVTNENGKFIFEAIPYTASGVYRYVVKEVIPEQAVNNTYMGITYDTTAFEIVVTVTDNGQGKLVASYAVTKNGTAAELKFVNAYNITNSTSFELEGSKVLTQNGQTIGLNGRVFTFVLYDANGVQIAVAHNDANGNFKFTNIPLTAVGTHTFTIKEQQGTLGGITYDTKAYTVTVNVTDNGVGGLTAGTPVITLNGVAADLKFTNQYAVKDTAASFRFEKVLNSWVLEAKKLLEAGMFSFQLYAADQNFQISGDALQTVTNLAGGGVAFNPITYTAPGTYYYVVKEVVPADAVNNVKDGITYDVAERKVTVTVVDNGDGTLTATPSYEGLRTFTNTYTISGSVNVDISGNKELTGRPMAEGEFSFGLYDAAGQQIAIVKNGANGSFLFQNVQLNTLGTHTFLVKEIKGSLGGVTYDAREYTVKITVTDDGKGGMVAGADVVTYHGVASDLEFTNSYKAEPTEYQVTAEKKYDKELTGGEFQFSLVGAGVNQVKQNAAGGAITFDKLTFTQAGTYTYTVAEMKGDKTYITYDDTVYTVKIVVKDDLNGKLYVDEVAVTNNKNSNTASVQFNNIYNLTPGAAFTVSGTKKLTGNKALTDGLFTFEMYEGGKLIASTTNVGGTFTFANVKLTELGEHTLTVVEKIPADAVNNVKDGITYSTLTYTVKVTVTDNGDGTMKASEPVITLNGNASQLVFTNSYTAAPAKYPLTAKKLYNKPMTGGEFQFQLEGAGFATQTKQNGADGTITFDALTFTEAKTYTFTVTETAGDKSYITYDKTVYTVSIQVTDNGKGQLEVTEVKVNDVTNGNVTFNNIYTVYGPAYVDISGIKVLEGRELKASEFTFQLYDAEGKLIATTKNAEGGSFVFDNVKLETLGTHTFTVKEVKGDKGGVTYDSKVYTVTVAVTDNNVGGMTVGTPVVTLNGNAAELKFTNSYKNSDTAEVTLSGNKTLTGRPLQAGEFSFTLSENGKALQTVTNLADGKFSFAPITYTAADVGTHVYTIAEVKGSLGGVKYDERTYTVTVTVTDNGEGKLVVTTSGMDGIRFENTYTTTPAKHILTAIKFYKNADGTLRELKGNEFTFVLSGEGITQTKQNGAGGSITFDELTFDKAGTYTFTVTETKGDKDYITYDGTEYTVTVTVTDNGKGKLEVTEVGVSNNKTAVEFNNTYTIFGTAAVNISGIKVLEGKTLAAGQFTFQLYKDGVLLASVQNAADGSFLFENVKLEALGTHTFTVVEKIPEDAVNNVKDKITYSTNVYTVTVAVTDNGEGGMTAGAPVVTLNGQSAELKFVNSFAEDPNNPGGPEGDEDSVDVKLNIQKIVESITAETIGPDGFVFVLYKDGVEIGRVTSDKDGLAAFQLSFDESALTEGTYTYEIREENNKKSGVTYSKAVYTVEIDVFRNEAGKLEAQLVLNDKAVAEVVAEFVNIYDADSVPKTGDDTRLDLMIIGLSVSALFILLLILVPVIKKRKNKKD